MPDEYIEQVVRVMQMADWHTYQVLTKRAERLRDLLHGPLAFAAQLEHIWWGVSVENTKHGLPRIDALREAPAAVRFLSVEPLLEDLGEIDLNGIHWVIVGGESGAGCAADGARNGSSVSASSARPRGAVLLQAMGRRAKIRGGPGTGRPDLRRDALPATRPRAAPRYGGR